MEKSHKTFETLKNESRRERIVVQGKKRFLPVENRVFLKHSLSTKIY
jgi:hypothetical protein